MRYDLKTVMELAPSPIVFEIYAKNFEKMKGIGVLENAGYWENFKPSMWQQYDYLQSPIDGYSSFQTTFMPKVYDRLRAVLIK